MTDHTPDTERCDALMKVCRHRQTNDRCRHRATVIIADRNLCAEHALMLASGDIVFVKGDTQ